MEDAPEPVYLRVEAVPDELPLPNGKGRLVLKGGGNAPGQVVQSVQGAAQLLKAALGKDREQPLDRRQLLHGGPEGHHIPAPGAAVDNAAHKPLHVADARQGQGQLLPGDGVVYQTLHAVGPAVNIPDAEQGPLQPAAEHPCAHGGFGLIQHPQKAALFLLAPEGLGKL